ncbi:hypothetical protein E2562_024150 [Oryza meyeriana var. granulata]|uniref:Uncharacterized protein n=1 Tax=Oryza meyeriana var. granulata TaxID=110450 RepID=A0A6G1EP59_9ORYZ|nr:hypothetical protein E2562_024150 [Oryza meyeriana var. granulata]
MSSSESQPGEFIFKCLILEESSSEFGLGEIVSEMSVPKNLLWKFSMSRVVTPSVDVMPRLDAGSMGKHRR